MDTLTHALSGALLGRAMAGGPGARRLSPRQALWAGAVAATFPDIDFVLGFVSELTYLTGHRGLTHSLLLLPAWTLLLASVFARLARARAQPSSAPDWRAFSVLAAAGILLHIAGDLITQFGTMILTPLSDRRFELGTTFIIDLVFTGIIAAGLLASALWRRSRIPATVALVALAGWVGVGWTGKQEALAAARAHAVANGIEIQDVAAIPRPASPFNWTAVVFDGERYHYAHINTRRQSPLRAGPDDNFIRRFSAPYQPLQQAEWLSRPRLPSDDPVLAGFVRSAWDSADFAFFRWFAMFPAVDHISPGPDGQRCVSFVDLRFETPGRDGTPFRYGLCGTAAHAGDSAGWRLFERAGDGLRWVQPR